VWKHSALPAASTQFLVFPIPTRVDITVYQHGKCFIFVKNICDIVCLPFYFRSTCTNGIERSLFNLFNAIMHRNHSGSGYISQSPFQLFFSFRISAGKDLSHLQLY
jgi:hypothetical protein